MKNKIVCIVGLGYVGLPLAQAFARSLKVIGFDTDSEKVHRLNSWQSSATSPQSLVISPHPESRPQIPDSGLSTLDSKPLTADYQLAINLKKK